RDFGDRYLRERRSGTVEVDPRKRMEGVVRGMKANGADVQFQEDDDKFVLSFRCGSGGMLIDGGAYAPPRDYLTLREPGPSMCGLRGGQCALPVTRAYQVFSSLAGVTSLTSDMQREPPPGMGARRMRTWLWAAARAGTSTATCLPQRTRASMFWSAFSSPPAA